MSFAELSPRQRVELVERFAAERTPPDDERLRLAAVTEQWLDGMRLAIVDDDVEWREELREGWQQHLDALPEVEADLAERRLYGFALYADGLLRSSEGETAA